MHHPYFIAALLGIVEGITEFLPISSTAHLRIFQHFFGLSLEDEFWKLFAIFIQLGAILSVVVLYRKRLMDFVRDVFSAGFFRRNPREIGSHPVSLITIAFFCTAIPAFLLRKLIGHNLESLGVMVASMAVGGVIMIIVDKMAGNGRIQRLEEMKFGQAVWIGVCQITSAIFPGTSRSMSTIAAGQIVGMSRPAALEFSFLLSIPTMAAATVFDLLRYVKEVGVGLTGNEVGLLVVGFVVSFIVAYAVVAWFLAYVRHYGFVPFGIYRLVFAAFLRFL